jgi:hypothetical protein
MKIHYRKPTLIEQMTDAIADTKQPIEYFELTPDELNSYYSYFDKSTKNDNTIDYSYKGIIIKVSNE